MPEIQLKNQVGDASSYDVNVVLLNSTEGTAKYISEHLITSQKQADWAITDQSDPGYIHNKPTIPEIDDLLPEIVPEEDNNKVLAVVEGKWAKTEMPDPKPQIQTDWNAVQEEGAEINLAVIKNKPTDLANQKYVQDEIAKVPQANWNETNQESKAFIQNKPADTDFQSDWTATDTASKSFIKNKPADADFQGDWNQNSSKLKSYIKNRPFYQENDLITEQTLTFTSSTNHPGKYVYYREYGTILTTDGNTAKTYTVEWDGTKYENCVCRDVVFRKYTDNYLYTIEKVIGNTALWENEYMHGGDTAGKSLPFVLSLRKYASNYQNLPIDWVHIITNKSGSSHKIRIYTSDHIHKIDPKFLPETVTATPDWKATSSQPGYIANKPTIPAAQVQSDWAQTDTTAADYIKNKPEVLDQLQSDWNEEDETKNSFILNKPIIPPNPVQADYGTKNSHSLSYIKNKIVGYYPDYIPGTRVTYKPHSLSGYYYIEFAPGEDDYSNTEYWVSCCGQGQYLKSGYYYNENSKSVSGLGNPSLAIYNDQPFVPREPINETLNFFINFDTNIITTKTVQEESSYVTAYRSNNIIQLPKKFLPGQLLPNVPSAMIAPYIGVENGEWTSKELPQSNWEETELFNPSTIINKPFGPKLDYMQGIMLGIGEESSINPSYYQSIGLYHALKELTYSKTVRLIWGEKEETVTGKRGSNYGIHSLFDEESVDMANMLVYGNISLLKNHVFINSISNPVDSGEDYCFCLLPAFTEEFFGVDSDGLLIVVTKEKVASDIFIKRVGDEYTKIDKKYLPDDLVIPTDKTLSKTDSPADASIVGQKIQEVKTSITKVDKRIKLGTEYAGQLVYVGEDGYPSVLRLGRGLTIKNGVLMVVESTETTSELDVGTLDTMVLPEE